MSAAEETILVIAGYAPSLKIFRGPLLKAMKATGRRVIAAAPDLKRDELAELGVECRNIPLSRTGVNPLADLKLLMSLVRLMRRERPTVVLGYTAKAVIYGMLAAAIAKVPRRYALITGLGYAFADEGKGSLVRSVQEKLYRAALGRTTKVFFQNHDDPALFKRLGLLPHELPVVVVDGSGVDLQAFAQAPIPAGSTRYLLIARLIAAKGIREYAAAARIVRRRYQDAEFHLVGGTDTNPDALSAAEIKRWTDDGTLVWHGELKDVRPQMAAAHVYVLPSFYREGVPRSILEALAMGRPVITTDAPGCRETVVDGENGFLVPPRDPSALAAAMERFITDPKLAAAMGQRSRALAERRFDVNKVNAVMLREMELA